MNQPTIFLLLMTLLIGFHFTHAHELSIGQDAVIYPKDQIPYSSIGKISEFVGVVVRNSGENQAADLYKFSGETKIAMTENLCETYTNKIFGPPDRRRLKLNNSVTLFDTRLGKTCAIHLSHPSTKMKFPNRYTLIGFIHGQVYALVWALPKNPSATTTEEFKNFWKTLK